MRCDVVIIGAGISGLACAAELSARGMNVVIFEARDHPGGRLATYRPPDGGPVLELGAQVIHGDRNPLRDLAASGLAAGESPPSHPVPRDGVAQVLLGGRIMPFGALARGGIPPWMIEQKLAADAGGHPGEVTLAGRLAADEGGGGQGEVMPAGWLGADEGGGGAGGVRVAGRLAAGGDGRGQGEVMPAGWLGADEGGGGAGGVRVAGRLAAGGDGRGQGEVMPAGWLGADEGGGGAGEVAVTGWLDAGGGGGGGGGGEVAVAGWMNAQGITGAHRVAAAEWFRQNWAADPAELSADGIAAARGADQTGDGEYAFDGGYLSLAAALAEVVPPIRLGQPADAVTWVPGRADVTAGRTRVSARAVVITVPPALIAGGRPVITPMPADKVAAARGLPAGDGLCAVAVLSGPAPESAVILDADGRAGFVRCTAGRPEVLIVAKSGAAATVRAAGPAGLATVIARVFPWSAGAELTSFRIADWGRDPWSAGAFSYPRPGARQAAASWAAPVQRTLFFAGEATTAGSLPPSVHGALGSGLAAARQVMEAWA